MSEKRNEVKTIAILFSHEEINTCIWSSFTSYWVGYRRFFQFKGNEHNKVIMKSLSVSAFQKKIIGLQFITRIHSTRTLIMCIQQWKVQLKLFKWLKLHFEGFLKLASYSSIHTISCFNLSLNGFWAKSCWNWLLCLFLCIVKCLSILNNGVFSRARHHSTLNHNITN